MFHVNGHEAADGESGDDDGDLGGDGFGGFKEENDCGTDGACDEEEKTHRDAVGFGDRVLVGDVRENSCGTEDGEGREQRNRIMLVFVGDEVEEDKAREKPGKEKLTERMISKPIVFVMRLHGDGSVIENGNL